MSSGWSGFPNRGNRQASANRHDCPVNDQRVGRALRVLRVRRGLRQTDVAIAAGVSQSVVSDIERGRISGMSLGTIRRAFAAVDAGFEGDVLWRRPAAWSQVARNDDVLRLILPARGKDVRRWLQAPDGDLGGIVFMALPEGIQPRAARQRVRWQRDPRR